MKHRGKAAGPGAPDRPARAWLGRVSLMAAIAALLPGCTSPEPPEVVPSLSPTAPVTPPASESPAAPEPITFAFEAPDPLCPPVSALYEFPHADEYPYGPVSSYLNDDQDDFMVLTCVYRREDIDVGDRVLEDYANLGGQVWLWRDIADAPPGTFLGRLPVESDHLADWEAVSHTRDEGVTYEGCGPEGTNKCADGEEPTVRLRGWRTELRGAVGNLVFNIWTTYRSADPPPDVELRTVAMLRSWVMAEVEGRERID